jgi:hypothetical protein
MNDLLITPLIISSYHYVIHKITSFNLIILLIKCLIIQIIKPFIFLLLS